MNIKAIPTNEVKLLSVYLMVSKDTMLTREGCLPYRMPWCTLFRRRRRR
ncbi:hypothetical protein [Vibrio phage J14]|nr:hypothetical protein [Vibrio phage J14]